MRKFLMRKTSRGRYSGRLWLAAMGGLVAILAVGGSTIARAEDDDDETFEEKIIKDVLGGLGVNVGRQNGIDYHERSPLVIPPTRDLPPPDTTGSVVNNPAWPVNPETRKKKKATTAAVNDNRSMAAGGYRRDESTPAELQKGAAAKAGRVTGPDPNANLDPGRPLKPSEMGDSSGPSWLNFGGLLGYKNEEQAPFKGEPPRTSLVQPPQGYQVPSPQYPYGINPDNKQVKIPDVMDRAVVSGTGK
jgi:hypothetical protein